MKVLHLSLIGGLALVAAGCAGIKATKVTHENDASAKGIRYALPKPFLQVSPKKDGTVAVDVIYLPDLDNVYAVDSWGWMSSSTFQVALDSGGLLSAIEFKQNTSAVGQQLATSAGAGAAQLYNMQAQQYTANQTAINTAQGVVDSGKSAADAAQAQLNSDTSVLSNYQANLTALQANPASSSNDVVVAKNQVTTAQNTVNTDLGNLAQAQAKYQDSQQTLTRVQSTTQPSSFSATAGTAITPTVPTPGTTGFGPQTWTIPPGYNLPENHGAVLYAINEEIDPKTGKLLGVHLNAVKWKVGTNEVAQQDFRTADSGLGPPTLGTQGLSYPLSGKSAKFSFSRPVKSIDASRLATAKGVVVPAAPQPVLDKNDNQTVTLRLDNLSTNDYVLSVQFTWGEGHFDTATNSFTVISP